MRLLTALLIIVLPAVASSQYKVTVILDKIPAKTTTDRIYMAGNFNEWNPADPETAMSKNADGKFVKVFDGVDPGTYEFKFTLGSTESTECKSDGTELPNRTVVIQSDTVIHLSVARWKNAKNLDDSERNAVRPLQLSSTYLLSPRIEFYLSRQRGIEA